MNENLNGSSTFAADQAEVSVRELWKRGDAKLRADFVTLDDAIAFHRAHASGFVKILGAPAKVVHG